jgi:hypothetical protein
MRYVINEHQYSLLLEENLPTTLRRRLTKSVAENLVSESIDKYPDLCHVFSKVSEYVFAVTYQSTLFFFRYFLPDYEDITKYFEKVRNIFINWFGEYIAEVYYKTCD